MANVEKMDQDAMNAQRVLDQMTEEQLDVLFPIGRKLSTGRYGWERLNGILNLRRCVFRTERAARADRRVSLFTHISPETFLERVTLLERMAVKVDQPDDDLRRAVREVFDAGV